MKRYLNKVLCISMIALSLCGCNKTNNDVEASAAADGPKTAKEVLEKSVEYYKGQTIKSLSAVATGDIKLKEDSDNSLNIKVDCGHVFKDNTLEIQQAKVLLTTTYNNKSYSVTLHGFDNGAIGYALNNGKVYDASDVSGMLGIKKAIPACENIVSDDVEETDMYGEEEQEETSQPEIIDSTAITTLPTDVFEIDDMLDMADRLALKGYKDVDGKNVYVLKGMLSNNGIINRVNEMIESNIYNLPTQYGDLTYEIYVDRETYEIIGMDIDLSNVIKTLSQEEKEVPNIINVRFELNKLTQLPAVEVRKAGLDNFSQIWTFMGYYSNVMNGLKK